MVPSLVAMQCFPVYGSHYLHVFVYLLLSFISEHSMVSGTVVLLDKFWGH